MASLRDAVRQDDREEIRLALVMTGGSSLAIWIGGVSREVHRLCTSSPRDGGAYSALLDVTRSTARADVIAGTSAGGLNGAFLALALARGGRMEPLGELWRRRGALRHLLRSPLEGDPPSLLRGDEYFLPELREALRLIHAGEGPRAAEAERSGLHLVMTTTSIAGRHRPFVDDYGNVMHEREHHAQFHFHRAQGQSPDPFDDPAIVERLALAARSTASFPAAFEPSYLPMDADLDRLHPAMGAHIDLERSGHVLDGGVLVNRPIQPALDAIFSQPAGAQVRRALLFIEPDPAEPDKPVDERYGEPPPLRDVVFKSLSKLPRAESVAGALEQVLEHNQRVRERRRVRRGVEHWLGGHGDRLTGLSDGLLRSYVEQRRAELVAGVLAAARHDRRPEHLRDARAPWWSEGELSMVLGDLASGLLASAEPPAGTAMWRWGLPFAWQWGSPFARRLAETAIDLFRRALLTAPVDEAGLRGELRTSRQQLHGVVASLAAVARREAEAWASLAEALPDPLPRGTDRTALLREAVRGQAQAGSALREELAQVDEAVGAAVGRLVELIHASRTLLTRVGESADVRDPRLAASASRFLDLRAAVYGGVGLSPAQLLERLQRLDVLFALMAPAISVEQRVDLLQVSGHTPNAFGGPQDITHKVTGTRLGHFGAFYKTSWRVNDWVWGRLDGAVRLAQVTLGPARMVQLGYTPQQALEAIRDAAVPPAPVGPDAAPEAARARADHEFLAAEFARATEECLQELAFLDPGSGEPVPPSLPACALQVARRLQAEILREELPNLADAVDDDVEEGALRDGHGRAFQAAYRDAARAAGGEAHVPASELLALFRACRIGRESVMDDAGSDLFAQTVSRAALVGTSAVEGARSGLWPLRVITRPLRALLLVLYVFVTAGTRGGSAGRAVLSLSLAAGGALLAVAAIDHDAPRLVAVVGGILATAGVLLAALLSRAWVLVAALGIGLLALFLLLYQVNGSPGEAAEQARTVRTVWTVGILVAVAWLVGTVRQPRALPLGFGGSMWRRAAVLAVSMLVLGGVLWGAAVAAGCPGSRPWDCEAARDARAQTQGIVALELAGTPARAAAVVRDWDQDDFRRAILGTKGDYGFLLLYWIPLTALAAIVAGVVRRSPQTKWTVRLGHGAVLAAWLPILAAALDAAENVGLLVMLWRGAAVDGISPFVPAVTAGLAALKFTLLAGVVAYCAATLLWALAVRLRPRTEVR